MSVTSATARRSSVARGHEADVSMCGQRSRRAALQRGAFPERVRSDHLPRRPAREAAWVRWTSWRATLADARAGLRHAPVVREYLDSHQLQPSMLTLGSNGAITNAARMGLGVALQSRWPCSWSSSSAAEDDPSSRRAALALVVRGLVDRRAGVARASWSSFGPCRRPGAAARRRWVKRTRSPGGQETGVERGTAPDLSMPDVRVDAGTDLGASRDQVVEQQGLREGQRLAASQVGADHELPEPLRAQVAGVLHPRPDRRLRARRRAPGACRPGAGGATRVRGGPGSGRPSGRRSGERSGWRACRAGPARRPGARAGRGCRGGSRRRCPRARAGART